LGSERPAIDIRGRTDVVNSVFDQYTATGWIVDAGPGLGVLNLVNCTVSRCGAAVFANVGATVSLYNSIAWDNEFSHTLPWSLMVVRNSLVQANLSTVGNPGNINADPLFTNPAAGDYTLQPGSPAIDAGSNALVPSGIALDFAGLPRFIDDPGTPNTGVGPAPIADMGAHEFQPQSLCRPDLTTTATPGGPGFGEPDGVVSHEDFFYYLFLFGSGAQGADMTTFAVPGSPGYGVPNGVINNDDFFHYLAIFVIGC
jgi:hypothetical protein